MPSPFPGMDPYLEGPLWPDVHHALASQIRRQIVSQLPSRYVARIETQIIIDRGARSELSIVYPDPDVALDLQVALAAIYDEAAYVLSIDYTQDPPPPPLRPEDQVWLRDLIASRQEAAA